MSNRRARYELIPLLLQAAGPLTLADLIARSGLRDDDALAALSELAREELVFAGTLDPALPSPQYRWAAALEREVQEGAARARRQLRVLVSATAPPRDADLDPESPPAVAWCDYLLDGYVPPPGKRILVFLQCSVRRPFYSSPSHGSLRRAVSVATGYDPAHDFPRCPVHVVVLASKIGPVPYELQELYPASVRGGGVNHFGRDH